MKQLSRSREDYEIEVTKDVVRDFAIIRQGLDKKPESQGKEAVLETIKRIKLLQLDTINIVERSHYLVLLSRIGSYEKEDLDSLFSRSALFEQRSHAACVIPIESYPFLRPEIINRRNLPIKRIKMKQLGEDPDAVFDRVLSKIKAEGPVSSKDFADDKRSERKGWWDRKPERVALEILWKRGYLAVERKANFQCYYNLTERVIPQKFLKTEYTLENFRKWAAINALDAQGIATVLDINDYYRQNLRETATMLDNLIKDGIVVKVKVDGWKEDAYVLSKDLNAIEELRNNSSKLSATTLLSPFDNLIWYRERMERLFGLHFRIEMYTPKEERSGGYYSMPILHKNRIVGTADPKVDRKNGIMVINSLSLMDGVEQDENLVLGLSGAITKVAKFTGCESIRVIETMPHKLKSRLEQEFKASAQTKVKVKA